MKWIVGIIGFIIAVKGGMDFGAATRGGSDDQSAQSSTFSYNEATPEEREVWLNAAADKLEKRGQREAGFSPYVSYEETIVRVRAREIQTVLELGPYVDFRMEPNTVSDALETACPHYIRDGLYANNIKWTQRLIKPNGMVAMNLTISPSTCQRFKAVS